MDSLGPNTKYFLDDYRVLLWQPEWLDMANPQDEEKEKSKN